jgi:hypothetical protein
METKESRVVEIASKEDLAKFLRDFSDGWGIGIERKGNRYFACLGHDNERVELVYSPNPNYLPSEFRSQIALYSFSPRFERKSAVVKLLSGNQ